MPSISCLRMIFILVLVCHFAVLLSPYSASAAQQNAYIKAEINYRPIWSTTEVDIEFVPDEALCREAYGSEWKDKCTVWLGSAGSVPKGLVAKDWPHGRWTWHTSRILRFQPSGESGGIPDISGTLTPSGHWQSATAYTANLQKLVLPPQVRLANTQVTVETLPLCARMEKGKMWVDPSDKAEHAVSFAMDFTAPVTEHQRKILENVTPVRSNLKVNDGLQLSKGTWVWLNDNTKAVVSARILALPQDKTIIKLALPHVRPIWEDDSKWHFPLRDAVQELIVPGTHTLFTLENVAIEEYQNKSLQMEQHLVFRFSRRVTAEALSDALTVLELPETRNEENILPSDWRQGNVAPQDMQLARKLTPEIVSIPGEAEDYIRLRINATPGRYIMWNIAAGFGPIDNSGKKSALQKSLEGVEYVPQGNPRVEMLQAGNILMLKEKAQVPILTEHIDTLRWKARRFRDENLALPFINTLDEPYISIEMLDSSTVVHGGEIGITPKAQTTAHPYTSAPTVTSLLADDIFKDDTGAMTPGVVFLELEGLKDGEIVAVDERVLMYSNLGLVVKSMPDGTRNAYVCSLNDAQPMKGVEVQVLGANGLPVASAFTDASGMAIIPSLEHLKREKLPTAIVASTQKTYGLWGKTDKIWMSLTDYSRTTNMHAFADVQGQQRSTSTLNAFVFAERGIFRPGESLNFGALLRNNDWSLLPANMPLTAILYDAADRQVYKQAFVAGTGVHSFSWQAPEHAITGRYRLTIATPAPKGEENGLVLGSTTVRVETFLPDTLKLKTSVEDVASAQAVQVPDLGKGWLVMPEATNTAGTSVKTQIRAQLDNLYGQAAQGRRIEASMRLAPAYLQFSGLKDYTFQDLSSFFTGGMDTVTRPLGEAITNEKGEATLPLDLSQWRFGTLQCTIATQGFEPDGGRSVAEERTILVSPLTYMLGYKHADDINNMAFIDKDSMAHLDFVTVDAQLKATNPGTLVFALSRRDSVISLVTNAQGQFMYEENPVDTELSQSIQQPSAEGTLHWAVPTNEVGDFLLTVKAGKGSAHEGVILARIPFSIAGTDDVRPALDKLYNLPSATLRIKTDKTAYESGETAKILLTAPYDGVALISLERDSVAAHKWIRVSAGQSVHNFPIPQNFAGRGYFNVIMGRAPQSNAIFMQPQSVALASVSVNAAQRQLHFDMKAPEVVRPGEKLQWHIKSVDGQATQAVLFAVDEGILQLTRFKTPNPLQYLLLDRALEVETAQLFDVMMADDDALMRRFSAFGGGAGDGAFNAMLSSFQNPFKRSLETPMVWWGGIVNIDAKGSTIEVPVPDHYNGKVRLMAIGNQNARVGSAHESVLVRGDLVLVPQLPTMAALGDSFDAGLGLSNTTDKAVTLTLAVTPTDTTQVNDLTLTGLPTSVTLEAKQEKLLPFNVRIGTQAGNAELRFTASTQDGSFTQERTASMSVRPGQLPRATQRTLLISQPVNLSVQRQLLPLQDAQDVITSISLSSTPMPLLRAVLAYLKHYPYDCVEQSVSQALPLALMATMPPFATMIVEQSGLMTDKEVQKTFKKAHDALIAAYRGGDGMSVWVDRHETTLFLTAYAADYILALREAQLPVPPGLLPQLFNTLENAVNSRPSSLEDLNDMAYAIWVLARAGYVVSRPLELCEAYLDENPIRTGIFRTLMAGAYALLHMQDEAKTHINYALGDTPAQWGATNTFDRLSQYGLHITVLSRHFPQYFQEALPFLQSALMEQLNIPYATLGASLAARGLLEVLKVTPQTLEMAPPSVHCGAYATGFAPATEPMVQVLSGISILNAPGCTNFIVDIPPQQKLFAEVETYGYDRTPPTAATGHEMTLSKKWSLITKDGETAPFTGSVQQGAIVRVDLEVRLDDRYNVPIAIVDLIPGGFELVAQYEGDTYNAGEIRLDRREDRFIAYLKATDSTQKLTYHIRAITKGKFTLPAAQAEGVLEPVIRATTPASKVEVVK